MGLFSNTSSRTNSSQNDAALRPITFRISSDLAIKKAFDVLQKYESSSISLVEDYHEIYLVKNDVEFTLTFVGDLGKTHLTVLAFSEKHPLRLKKGLKELTSFIRKELETYIE